MRTTIDLPADLHQQALTIARDNHQTLSKTVSSLLRKGLGYQSQASVYQDSQTGRTMLEVGRPITDEDVRSLEDNE
ncbi:MAG: hypothetical protein FWG47_08585 [Propionibacteriaceae bacterium]|nr:hypothetical protein [Propionibacteriaceae bacterium]